MPLCDCCCCCDLALYKQNLIELQLNALSTWQHFKTHLMLGCIMGQQQCRQTQTDVDDLLSEAVTFFVCAFVCSF